MLPAESDSPTSTSADVLIAGGGLAGLTAAIILSRAGYKVILLEKKDYPRHKVCGEYISNEITPLLTALQLFPTELKPVEISRFMCSGIGSKTITCELDPGGFGISRYALDNFLYQKALAAGAAIRVNTAVDHIQFADEYFTVRTANKTEFTARIVIGAHGKRSVIDKSLDRAFTQNSSVFMGVKMHYQAEFPSNLVALHNFEGGYAGLSTVENNIVNLCYLTTTTQFERYRDLNKFKDEHLARNYNLRNFLKHAEPVFDRPLVISQINFDRKPVVEGHVLMCGDSAGLIHPLCGNGMAMAIHAAALGSSSVISYLKGQISRPAMEQQYRNQWQLTFNRRLWFGKHVSGLFGKKTLTKLGINMADTFPSLFQKALDLSHGSYVQPSQIDHV